MSEVKISQDKYDKMQRQIAKLEALEAGGVDNWEWYGESLKDWFAENELMEAMDDAIEGINDVLVDADVDQPAGSGCGYSIAFDEDAMKKVMASFLEKAMEIEQDKRAIA